MGPMTVLDLTADAATLTQQLVDIESVSRDDYERGLELGEPARDDDLRTTGVFRAAYVRVRHRVDREQQPLVGADRPVPTISRACDTPARDPAGYRPRMPDELDFAVEVAQEAVQLRRRDAPA